MSQVVKPRDVKRGLVINRLSMWTSLAAVALTSSYVTWLFMAAPALEGRTPSVFEVGGWVFWMTALAIVSIWACWVKTHDGWRWRWQRS